MPLPLQEENVSQNVKIKLLVLGVFVDSSNAHYLPNHELLIIKLEPCGFRGISLDIFRSYVGHRRQYVAVNG